MESTAKGTDFTREGTRRAGKARTRAQTKLQADKDAELQARKQGLSADKWWKEYVRSQSDVINFYEIYHPEYPDILVKAIAMRLDGIIQKTRTGQPLTEEEYGYITRSKAPSSKWDPMEEIVEHEFQAKLQNTIKGLESLL